MISIGIVENNTKEFDDRIVKDYMKISDDIVVFGRDENQASRNNVRWGGNYNENNFAELIESMCSLAKNDFFVLCTTSSKIHIINSRSIENYTFEGKAIVFLMDVLFKPGGKKVLTRRAMKYSVFGKIINKNKIDVDVLSEMNDADLVSDLMFKNNGISIEDSILYYEYSTELLAKELCPLREELFLESVKYYKNKQQVGILKKWIASNKTNMTKSQKIRLILTTFKDNEKVAGHFKMKHRVKQKIIQMAKN